MIHTSSEVTKACVARQNLAVISPILEDMYPTLLVMIPILVVVATPIRAVVATGPPKQYANRAHGMHEYRMDLLPLRLFRSFLICFLTILTERLQPQVNFRQQLDLMESYGPQAK